MFSQNTYSSSVLRDAQPGVEAGLAQKRASPLTLRWAQIWVVPYLVFVRKVKRSFMLCEIFYLLRGKNYVRVSI